MDESRITALMMRVGELERKLEFVMQHLRLDYRDEALPAAMTEAAKWLQKGNKIEAIKAYREATGAGLKDAKDAVDALERRLGVG